MFVYMTFLQIYDQKSQNARLPYIQDLEDRICVGVQDCNDEATRTGIKRYFAQSLNANPTPLLNEFMLYKTDRRALSHILNC